MSSVGAWNEVVLTGLAFEVLAEVGVREADHRLRPLGDRLALEVDAAVLGDDVHRVGPRRRDDVAGRELEDDPAAAIAALVVGRREADERLAAFGGIGG